MKTNLILWGGLLCLMLLSSCQKGDDDNGDDGDAEQQSLTITVNGKELHNATGISPDCIIDILYTLPPSEVVFSLKSATGEDVPLVQRTDGPAYSAYCFSGRPLQTGVKYTFTVKATWSGAPVEHSAVFTTVANYQLPQTVQAQFFFATGTASQAVKGEMYQYGLGTYTPHGHLQQWNNYNPQDELLRTQTYGYDTRFPHLTTSVRQETVGDVNFPQSYITQTAYDAKGLWTTNYQKHLDGTVSMSETRTLTYIGNMAYLTQYMIKYRNNPENNNGWVYIYDADGKEMETVLYAADLLTVATRWVKEEWDEYGNHVKSACYNNGGTEFAGYTTYEWKGRLLVKETAPAENYWTFAYDDNGNRTETAAYDKTGMLLSKTTSKYNAANQQTELCEYQGYIQQTKYTWAYDANGNETEATYNNFTTGASSRTKTRYNNYNYAVYEENYVNETPNYIAEYTHTNAQGVQPTQALQSAPPAVEEVRIQSVQLGGRDIQYKKLDERKRLGRGIQTIQPVQVRK